MTPRHALWSIVGISLLGIAFSGTLTYREICAAGGGGCSASGTGALFGFPICVYGLLMYLVIGVVALLGLRAAPAAPAATQAARR